MNSKPSPLWTNDSTEKFETGSWRNALPEYIVAPSPCHGACPVSGDIATWIQQVKSGEFHAAWLTLVENNPFPSIAGRICHHPCESVCHRAHYDSAVGICSLEEYVGDQALNGDWSLPMSSDQREERIAVVGGGPSGLSAACQLRRRGYSVTLYEARDQLGGLMHYGIPPYRLSREILSGEIQRILDLGVQVHLNTPILGGAALANLKQKYDSVFIATGASRSARVPGLDYAQSWVIDSAVYLSAANAGQPDECGERLLVIGAGSAAMDVARTARRFGKKVTILSLESRTQLPAQQMEVEESLEEGVQFIFGAKMLSVEAIEDGLQLSCTKVHFKPAETGRKFNIEFIAGTEFTLTADAIVPAIGQEVELPLWEPLLKSEGPVIKTDVHGRTNVEGIFAGGDMASMDRYVTEAVGMGKRAALNIDHYLHPELSAAVPPAELEVPYLAVNKHYHNKATRNDAQVLCVGQRLGNFAEVIQGLKTEQAAAEATRCFSCGTCTYCDSCYLHCPDMAIIKLEQGYSVNTAFCKGCGLCVAECPTGSITMREEYS